MAKRKTEVLTEEQLIALEAISPREQNFIEALLAGKNISEAALIAGISRRAAAYWLADPGHKVTLAYEDQRALQLQAFSTRIANLYSQVLKTMEDALSDESPMGIRFAAAKFLYEHHLSNACQLPQPATPLTLVSEIASTIDQRQFFDQYRLPALAAIPSE